MSERAGLLGLRWPSAAKRLLLKGKYRPRQSKTEKRLGASSVALVQKAPLRVLGIMSGTSLDGVDCAMCDVSADAIKLLKLWRAEFPRVLQSRLKSASCGEVNSWELAQLHHDLGRFYSAATKCHASARRAQLIGLHGQTVFHHPHRTRPATLQLGEPTYLAEALRVPVVSNFRVADLAAGGQGAPLATLFHQVVFAKRGQHVCVNNLGGISNVTSLDWRRGAQPRVLAFDTGPANMLLDLAMRHFTHGRQTCDRDGRRAAKGKVCEPLIQRWLRHPFFRKTPPKSTGRELFGESFLLPALAEMKRVRLAQPDCLATLSAFTAHSIALNYKRHLPTPPSLVVLSGGGANNPVLRKAIASALRTAHPSIQVQTSADLGWPPEAIEAAAFALLAWRRWYGLAGNLPSTTGARRA
ncbi:MAG: anhydro-N-acetylmuramic acid kinase, partial [Verrucomicrobia bacterium]|nr:anhydro-N-acetylmuramic acid kinase [Verrucomicrobiota bacterium]